MSNMEAIARSLDAASPVAELRNIFESVLAAHSAGDTAAAVQLLRDIGRAIKPGKTLDLVNAAQWLKNEPAPPDQIIVNLWDVGDKMATIAPPKLKKSFATLQGCICLASGADFLGLTVAKPRRVLLVQLEIPTHHFHQRVRLMFEALRRHGHDVSEDLVGQNLNLINARGIEVDFEEVRDRARDVGAEIVVFDPLYKLHDGDENSAKDMKRALRHFDELAEEGGLAVWFVHHDAKGTAGDRDIRDRGAGSNTVGRDYDVGIALTPHRTEDNAIVISFLCRNYPPRRSMTIVWEDGAFRTSDLAAVAKTTATSRQKTTSSVDLADLLGRAVAEIRDKPLISEEFYDRLRTKLDLSDRRARLVACKATTEGMLKKSRRQGFGGAVFIGLPSAIAEIDRKYENSPR